jgi:hypothetical protein
MIDSLYYFSHARDKRSVCLMSKINGCSALRAYTLFAPSYCGQREIKILATFQAMNRTFKNLAGIDRLTHGTSPYRSLLWHHPSHPNISAGALMQTGAQRNLLLIDVIRLLENSSPTRRCGDMPLLSQ